MTCNECLCYEVCEALESIGISKVHPKQCGYYKNSAEFENKIKADTVKKMQERIAEEAFHEILYHEERYLVDMDDINQIAKEILEGNDEVQE